MSEDKIENTITMILTCLLSLAFTCVIPFLIIMSLNILFFVENPIPYNFKTWGATMILFVLARGRWQDK